MYNLHVNILNVGGHMCGTVWYKTVYHLTFVIFPVKRHSLQKNNLKS